MQILKKVMQIASLVLITMWRGVRDLNPRGPKDHRLSRPRLPNGTAPYQARATPPRYSERTILLKKFLSNSIF